MTTNLVFYHEPAEQDKDLEFICEFTDKEFAFHFFPAPDEDEGECEMDDMTLIETQLALTAIANAMTARDEILVADAVREEKLKLGKIHDVIQRHLWRIYPGRIVYRHVVVLDTECLP